MKCEETLNCNSVDYNKKTLWCHLSKETSLTLPLYYYKPCYVDKDNQVYAEILPKGEMYFSILYYNRRGKFLMTKVATSFVF